MNLFSDNEDVAFYPTYGYREDDEWIIPMRAWVSERRKLVEKTFSLTAQGFGVTDEVELKNFNIRVQDFLADSESDEAVEFVFDDDPINRPYRILTAQGQPLKTDLNGLVEGFVRLPVDKAAELLQRQKSLDGWLSFRATSKDHQGVGNVRLLDLTGLSVISDIDDTIKVTQILAGARTVIQNTFFRDFIAASGMAEKYRGWAGAAFHYVSGGPWQLYRPLSEFLFSRSVAFPPGSFHMRSVTKNLLSVKTWEGLGDFVTNENHTLNMKVAYISAIIQHFPQREFVLVGDSGEKDPEVYQSIKAQFPTQIREIWIRDVAGEKSKNNARLTGMQIIEP